MRPGASLLTVRLSHGAGALGIDLFCGAAEAVFLVAAAFMLSTPPGRPFCGADMAGNECFWFLSLAETRYLKEHKIDISSHEI